MFTSRKSRFMGLVLVGTATAAITGAGFAGLAGSASASTIYQESFARTGSLGGLSPAPTDSNSATWSTYSAGSSNGWQADGSITVTAATYQLARLAFAPVSGNIYTLSETLSPDAASGGYWFGLGFGDNSGTPLFQGQGPWMLLQGNGGGQTFTGPGTTGNTTKAAGSYSPGQTAEVVLNTENSDWTVQWFYNGTPFGGKTYTYTGATGSNPNPTGIQNVSFVSEGASGSVGNFTLTDTVVPEPATWGLFAIGGLGLLLLKRRKVV